MANYATLKAAIQAVIKQNGNKEITGDLLQQALISMINSLGDGYQFMGVATPSTNPGTPDQRVVYIGGPGIYPNFDAEIPSDKLGIMFFNSTWNVSTVDLPPTVSVSGDFLKIGENKGARLSAPNMLNDISGYVSNRGWMGETYFNYSYSNSRHLVVPIEENTFYLIRGRNQTDECGTTYFALVKSYEAPTGTEPIDFAGDMTARDQVQAEESRVIYSGDAKFIIFSQKSPENMDCLPSLFSVDIISELDDLGNFVFNGLVDGRKNRHIGWPTTTGWVMGSGYAKHFVVPVFGGLKIIIDANSDYPAYFGFLSDYTPPVDASTPINYVPGTTRIEIAANTHYETFAPLGSKYIVFGIRSEGTTQDCTPSRIKLDFYATIENIEAQTENPLQVDDIQITFGQPVEIFSNKSGQTQFDNKVLEYFNIIQLSESMYYLYYTAFGQNSAWDDYEQNVLFAYSTDGIHFTRGFPDGITAPFPGTNKIFADGVRPNVTGQFVFMVPDKDYPFRIIMQQNESGNLHYINMYKSPDGINFEQGTKQILLREYHDTQHSVVVRGNVIKLYTRTRTFPVIDGVTHLNRKNCVYFFDIYGKMLSPIKMLASDYVYNAAAVAIDDRLDLITPTHFDNTEIPASLDLDSYERYQGWPTASTWHMNGPSRHFVIPVTPGQKYKIVARDNYTAYYGVLSSYTPPVSSTAIPYVSGTSRVELGAGQEATITIPAGGYYLLVGVTSDGVGLATPQSISQYIRNESFSVENIVVDGYKEYHLTTNVNTIFGENDKWVIFSPSLLTIGGVQYLAYYTHDTEHDTTPTVNDTSKYCIVPITLTR